jgi:hypothetical protein
MVGNIIMYFKTIKTALDMKIKFLIILAMAFSFTACENQDNDFDDFGSTSVYFPFQTPVRTLIQGKYNLGSNENDNNSRFEIGVIMSGVYENTSDRRVHFELASDLIDPNALTGIDSVNVQVLPSSYYTIEQSSPVTIPAGSTNGRIPIQLEDAFFDDPLAFAEFGDVHYVIPLRITDFEALDSLLTGIPIVDNPIKIRPEDWNPAPKDYTLFGVKFFNKYHGSYLRRGEDKVVGTSKKFTNATGVTETTDIDDSTVYRAEFVVQDEVTPVSTAGRNKVISTNLVRRAGIPSNSTVSLELSIDDNGGVTITNADEDSSITITGTGTFVEEGDEWGGEKRDVIYLEYQYQDIEVVEEKVFGQVVASTTVDLMHTVNDTLVIRDRDVKFEEFVVELRDE